MINKLYKKVTDFIKENFVFILFLVGLTILLTINLPWSSYTPGGVIDVSSRLSGEKYESKGRINMTYVTFVRGTIPSLLISLIHPEWDIVSNKDITLEGEDLKIANKRDKISMQESISNATFVAYKNANITFNIKSTKTYIMYILNEADTNLEVGDQILEYDNIVLEDYKKMQEYIKQKEFGEEILFKVLRNDKEKNVKAKIVKIDGKSLVGISLSNIYEYDENVTVKYQDKASESGSSGGLMLSLAMYNSLIEEDITKKKNICGTGTIDLDGNVGEISGVKYKLAGAVKNKCDVFLIPKDNYQEAKKVQDEHDYDIKIIEANNFLQVLEELKKL